MPYNAGSLGSGIGSSGVSQGGPGGGGNGGFGKSGSSSLVKTKKPSRIVSAPGLSPNVGPIGLPATSSNTILTGPQGLPSDEALATVLKILLGA